MDSMIRILNKFNEAIIEEAKLLIINNNSKDMLILMTFEGKLITVDLTVNIPSDFNDVQKKALIKQIFVTLRCPVVSRVVKTEENIEFYTECINVDSIVWLDNEGTVIDKSDVLDKGRYTDYMYDFMSELTEDEVKFLSKCDVKHVDGTRKTPDTNLNLN